MPGRIGRLPVESFNALVSAMIAAWFLVIE
jgi:hypothetical protein